MLEIICDTSPIQYLYQLKLLHILPALSQRVIVPPAVVDELATGRALGVSLPKLDALDWVVICRPVSALALPLVTDLGPGETEVLMLALESREAVAVLDDALARQVAETLGLCLTGTCWACCWTPSALVSSLKLAPYWINFRLCVFASLRILTRRFSNSPEKWTTTMIEVSGKEIHVEHVARSGGERWRT